MTRLDGRATVEVVELLRDIARVVEVLLFGALAVAAWRQWRRRHDEPALWFALMAAALVVVVVAGAAIGEVESGPLVWAAKANIAVLALFPFFLFRFM